MKPDTALKQQAVGGMFWKFSEKVGMQVIQFILQIVLARLLLPDEYGIVGILTVFIVISDVFIQQGFTLALIRKKDADQLDFSSVFFANLGLSLIIYAILFFCAPLVAKFYDNPSLTGLMRVLSLNVIFGAFSAVHNVVLSRELDFKKSFFRSLFNVGTQGVVGIVAAYMGLGAWALVFSKTSGVLVGSIVLIFTVRWRPTFAFSGKRIKGMMGFSSKVLASNLLNTTFNNIHPLIIGGYYSSASLGFYQRGQQFPNTFMVAIDGSLSEVIYPTLSKLQDDIEKLKFALRRAIKTSLYVVMPLLFGMIAVAENFVLVLLTDKWLPCVPFLQLQCIGCMFWPFAMGQYAINALGKGDVALKVSIITKIFVVLQLVICIPISLTAVMIGAVVSSFLGFIIIAYFVKKHVKYKYREQLLDILPSLGMSLVMMVAVWGIGLIQFNIYLKLIVQVVSGVLIYLVMSLLTKNKDMVFIKDIIKGFIKK